MRDSRKEKKLTDSSQRTPSSNHRSRSRRRDLRLRRCPAQRGRPRTCTGQSKECGGRAQREAKHGAALLVQCLVFASRRAKLQRRTRAIILILHQCAALRIELGLRAPADLERLR
ncbi:hypothetical protein ACER0C_016473 [Sarotherodon galilaeus]